MSIAIVPLLHHAFVSNLSLDKHVELCLFSLVHPNLAASVVNYDLTASSLLADLMLLFLDVGLNYYFRKVSGSFI